MCRCSVTDHCHGFSKLGNTLNVGWRTANVREGVAAVVIATKGKVNPTHKRQRLVDNNHFLVVSPKEDIRLDVVRVTKYLQCFEKEGLSQLTRTMVKVANFKSYNH